MYTFNDRPCRRSRRYDLDITFRERIGHDLAYLSSFSQSSVVIYDTGNRAWVLSPVHLSPKKQNTNNFQTRS